MRLKSDFRIFGRYLHWHWQNLMECPKCGTAHGLPWHGRAWLSIYPGTDQNGEPEGRPKEWHVEWMFFHKRIKSLTAGFSFGGGDSDSEIQLHSSFPVLWNLWLSCENYISPQYNRGGERDVTLRYDFDYGSLGSLWWNVWTPTHEWSNKTPRWRNGSFDLADFLLGPEVHFEHPLSHQYGYVDYPEGRYTLSLQKTKSVWIRKRWPYPRAITRWKIEPDRPIPVPGKGENSWDCDEDAVDGMTVAAETADEALAAFVASIDGDRHRYGGDGWVPKAKGGKVN